MSQVLKYVPGEMDWLLLNWMSRMKADGELAHTLSLGVHQPLAFLNFMSNRALFFQVSELNNISRAAWFEPLMGNTFMSYYVAPEFRTDHEEKVFFLFDMLNLAFVEGAQTVVGLIQERATEAITQKFIKLHLRLGYEYCGRVPHLFDGRDCYIVSYTVEHWKDMQDGGWQTRWRRNRESARAADITSASSDGAEPSGVEPIRAAG